MRPHFGNFRRLCKISVTGLEERLGGCFYRLMQALSDEQRVEALEKKIDNGFAEMRTEFKAVRGEIRTESAAIRAELGGQVMAARNDARSDFRTLISVMLTMLVAMIFGFASLTFAVLSHM
jgi:hypothetical protein